MTIRDDLVAATDKFAATKKAYTAKLTAMVNKINARQALTASDWTDLIVNTYNPMTNTSDNLRALATSSELSSVITASDAFTAAKKAYTAKLTLLVNKLNMKQPLTNADWSDLVVKFYNPMTTTSDALRATVSALPPDPASDPRYDDGRLWFYHTKHGAKIGASGPGDIVGGAFLVDKGGEPTTAAKWSFGKAKPDGNFEILRNGTPFGTYTGVMVGINHGEIAIRNKAGVVVYGTFPAPDDKTAHLT